MYDYFVYVTKHAASDFDNLNCIECNENFTNFITLMMCGTYERFIHPFSVHDLEDCIKLLLVEVLSLQ